MERVLIYGFACLFLMVWLADSRDRKKGKAWGKSLLRLIPPFTVTAMMLIDNRSYEGGIPASLLAADLLYLDALVLHGVRFISEKRRVSFPFLLVALAGPARSAYTAAGHPSTLDPCVCMVLLSGLMLSCTVVGEIVRMFPSGRLRGILQEHVSLVFMKVASAQGLTLAGAVILAAPAARALCLAFCALLAAVYAYIQFAYSLGTPHPRVIPAAVAAAARQAAPDRTAKDESRREELLFERVEAYMQREKPYLDDTFTLTRLATEMMTNKSMLSKTINDKSGNNFCRYVNAYRIRHALSLMQRDRRLKVSELSMMSGFHTVASFNMAFKLIMSDTPSEYMRTLHSAGLARPAAGERPVPEGSP